MPAAHHAVHVKCAFLVCRLSSGVLDHIQHQPRPKPMNPHHIAVFFLVRARASLLRRLRQLCRRIERCNTVPKMGASRFRRDRLRLRRHVGVWAPVIACKTKVANDNLALAA